MTIVSAVNQGHALSFIWKNPRNKAISFYFIIACIVFDISTGLIFVKNIVKL